MKKKQSKKLEETCHLGEYSLKFNEGSHTSLWKLNERAKDESSFIHEHLMTLYFIAREFRCKSILEIGTGNGESTLALASAARFIDGHVTTIDVDPYELPATSLIAEAKLEPYVTFLKHDVKSPIYLKGKFDLVFIDGNHSEEGVKDDIVRYTNHHMKPGGFIIFHDTTNPKWGKDVRNGIRDCWLDHDGHIITARNYQVYEWLNCNGLMVCRVK